MLTGDMIHALLTGARQEDIKPYGHDLRLGVYGIRDGEHLSFTQLVLEPGSLLLCEAMETVAIPASHLGLLFGRSSDMRRGLWMPSGVVHPGWRGILTLEFTAVGRESVVVCAGSPIAHLVVMHSSLYSSLYSGRYQDQEGTKQ